MGSFGTFTTFMHPVRVEEIFSTWCAAFGQMPQAAALDPNPPPSPPKRSPKANQKMVTLPLCAGGGGQVKVPR